MRHMATFLRLEVRFLERAHFLRDPFFSGPWSMVLVSVRVLDNAYDKLNLWLFEGELSKYV